MKIKKLIFQNFGPYHKETTIFFEPFQKKNLLLIHGQTGSGKSTILDAIVFALYGELSDASKSARYVISDYKGEEEKAFVEFIFELKGKDYRIYRVPEQLQKKKRGEGEILRKPEAELYYLKDGDWTLFAGGIKEVQERIQELIGLTSKQFRQMIVLPQGKFRDILLSDTEEREKLLEQIFSTNLQDEILSELKRERDFLQELYRDAEQKKAWHIQELLQYEGEEREELEKIQIEDLAIKKDELKKDVEMEQVAYELLLNEKKELEFQRGRFDLFEKSFLRWQKNQRRKEELNLLTEQMKNLKKQLDGYEKVHQVKDIFKNILITQKEHDRYLEEYQTEEGKKDALFQCKNYYEEKEKILTQNKAQVEKEKEEQEKIQRMLETIEMYRGMKKEISHIKLFIETLHVDKYEIEEKLQKIEVRSQLGEKALSNAIFFHEQKEELERKYQLYSEYQENEKKIEGWKDQFQLLESRWQLQNKEYEIEKNHQRIEEERYHKLFSGYLESQAYQLSELLEEGIPCPVCGSFSHPKKAQKKQSGVSREELSSQKELLQRCTKESELLYQQVQTLQIEKEQIRIQIIEATKIHKEHPGAKWEITSLDKEKMKIQEEMKKNQQLIDEREKIKQEREELQKALLFCKEKIAEKNSELREKVHLLKSLSVDFDEEKNLLEKSSILLRSIEQWNVQVRQDETILRTYENKVQLLIENTKIKKQYLERIREKLSYLKNKMASEQINETVFLEDIIKAIAMEADYSSMREKWSIFQKEMDTIQIQLEQDKALAKEYNQESLVKLEEQISQNQMQMHHTLEKLENAKMKKNSFEKYYNFCMEEEKQGRVRDNRFGLVSKFYDAIIGQNPKGISLKRYLLRTRFQEVLQTANYRLAKMTQNRFQLYLSEERGDRRKKWGLDISVEDCYTGRLRPVNTLSGGESFITALSLALGMADVVESYSGGVRLDSLFIDEGFGSLDPDSLDRAIEVLQELQERGRLIGIISHVEELKDRIASKIQVFSTPKGSYVEQSHFS